MFGYRYGLQSMRELAEGGFRRVTSSFSVLGLIVAGGIGASIITLATPGIQCWRAIHIGPDQLDAIFPKLLPFVLVLWLWDGMRRRGWPINRALGMTFWVIFLGYLPYLIGVWFNIPFLQALRIF
jgi:mannose/fructose/N-acetylgalactosamine-specific phosphotransferase system component IID